ncbi:pectin lyase fold/virulence factor [Ilyonectria robusta]|uniref:pectin lyase fold/virulence factor n=1 Tax=Ilyonectria robusta TaxID=1079257 RepID=UPI001E8D986C|nr:pectin lyase fold/virulence factor [Ilyonectria robusta]KAH8663352.1 pectin lyase fold/virulence factor [Ilyonectria robusta]
MIIKPLLLISALLCGVQAKLKTYPVPSGIAKSTAFTANVRTNRNGAVWQPLDIYEIGLHEINTTTGSAAVRTSSYTYFDFTGMVEIAVRYNNAVAQNVRVRPDSYGIIPPIVDGWVNFTISKPQNLVIQVNNQTFDVLHVAAAHVQTHVPSSTDPDVIYYGAGVHDVTGGVVNVPSGKTLYLAGGAVLRAGVTLTNTTGSSIRGRGMIYKPKSGVATAYAQDTLIEGITLISANIGGGQATGFHIRDVKSFSAVGWGDGMDFYCSKNVLVERVFMRNSDDCIAIYSHRDNWWGDSKNITIKDSSLWADVAHPINIGTHGNSDNPETISDLTIENIDILDHREAQVGYQGCIAINPGDSNVVKDVLISDVRVEDFRLGELFTLRVMYNTKYNTSPGRGIKNVVIRNLNYTGTHASMAVIAGYDETRNIENVTFQGLVINGKAIYDAMRKPTWYQTTDFIPAFVNEHVKNLTFLS